MRRRSFRLLTATLATGLWLAACGGHAPGRAVVGYQSPALIDVKWIPPFPIGEQPAVFNEAPLAGKVVLLDFFASWCGPCRATAPHLAELRDQHAKDGLFVIGVTQETVPTAMKFAAELKWDGRVAIAVDENKTLGRAFSVIAYPTTVIVDRQGIVRWRAEGAAPADIDRELAKWLGPAPGAGG